MVFEKRHGSLFPQLAQLSARAYSKSSPANDIVRRLLARRISCVPSARVEASREGETEVRGREVLHEEVVWNQRFRTE